MKPLLPTSRSESALNIMFKATKDFLPVDDKQYIDPFCGAAEIPFELEIGNCILNDSNPHIINLYEWVKSGKFLKDGWLITRKTDLNNWAKNKGRFNKLIRQRKIHTVEAAQLTFYLHHVCRRFTFGTSGVMIGAHDRNAELPEIDWKATANLMQGWELKHNDDYTQFEVPENAPLIVSAPVVYVMQWDGNAWDPSAHRDLLHWLEPHSGKIMVFHPRRQVIEDLYADWTGGDRVFQLV